MNPMMSMMPPTPSPYSGAAMQQQPDPLAMIRMMQMLQQPAQKAMMGKMVPPTMDPMQSAMMGMMTGDGMVPPTNQEIPPMLAFLQQMQMGGPAVPGAAPVQPPMRY